MVSKCCALDQQKTNIKFLRKQEKEGDLASDMVGGCGSKEEILCSDSFSETQNTLSG